MHSIYLNKNMSYGFVLYCTSILLLLHVLCLYWYYLEYSYQT